MTTTTTEDQPAMTEPTKPVARRRSRDLAKTQTLMLTADQFLAMWQASEQNAVKFRALFRLMAEVRDRPQPGEMERATTT